MPADGARGRLTLVIGRQAVARLASASPEHKAG
jgi:hypothetical protein